jgi:hypothetical protein
MSYGPDRVRVRNRSIQYIHRGDVGRACQQHVDLDEIAEARECVTACCAFASISIEPAGLFPARERTTCRSMFVESQRRML